MGTDDVVRIPPYLYMQGHHPTRSTAQGLYADNMPCNVMYTDQTVRAAGRFRSNGSRLLCPGLFFSPIESPLDHVPIELLVVTWRCIGNKSHLNRADPKRGSRCSPTPRHVQRWKRTSVVVRYSIQLLTIGLPNMLAGQFNVLCLGLDGSTPIDRAYPIASDQIEQALIF